MHLFFLRSQLLYHIMKQELEYKCQLEVAYVHFCTLLLAWWSEDTKKMFCQILITQSSYPLGHYFPLTFQLLRLFALSDSFEV